MSLLEIRGLCAAHAAADVLHEVVLDVAAGEAVTLIGANGAGKSTTLLAISGLVRKTAGSVLFDGKDITAAAAHAIVRLGVVHVPEGRGIFPRLSVEENLKMGAFIHGRPDPADLEHALALFPVLADRKNQPGGTLSGGEQQMLAIARGLMSKPRLLLLDEPSLGIAPKLTEKIFAALREIRAKGVTILLVEQNAHLALEFADRAYVLESGRITLTGSGRDLAGNEEVKKAYLGI